jgi:hypothetical protein
MRIRDGNTSDPGWKKVGSGINIPDLQHCDEGIPLLLNVVYRITKLLQMLMAFAWNLIMKLQCTELTILPQLGRYKHQSLWRTMFESVYTLGVLS